MPHKKSHKVRRGKKTGRKTMKKRGGYYGVGQTPPVATGAASVTSGHEVPVKGGRRSRKSRSRKMRGGSSIGTVTGYSFGGQSVGGNGNAVYSGFNAGHSNDVIPT